MATKRYLDQRLRLPLLRAVDAIETHRSLLKASAALGLSQPALTKSLQELEETLQLRLFERLARGGGRRAAGGVDPAEGAASTDPGADAAGTHRAAAAAARFRRNRPDRRSALSASRAGRVRTRGTVDGTDFDPRPRRTSAVRGDACDPRRAPALRSCAADHHPARRTGDREPACSARACPGHVAAIEFLRLHPRDAARHRPALSDATADA